MAKKNNEVSKKNNNKSCTCVYIASVDELSFLCVKESQELQYTINMFNADLQL